MTYSQNIPASSSKQSPDRSAWWSLTKRGYRLTPAGSAGLSRLGIEQRPGTFVSQKRLVTIRDNWILSRKPTMRSLAERVKESGDLNGWIRAMREEIRDVHRANYILGRGGLKNMAQADWGRLGGTLGQQYNYLNDFATKIATTPDLSADYIAARSQMYMESSGVSFERGKAAGIGVPALPEHPGDGNTQCLCITTPHSRVLTKQGLKAIADVVEGDFVWTHKLQWKKVIGTVIKPSQPYHEHILIKMPGGQWVGATHDHKWFTIDGWLGATDIDNLLSMVYHLPSDIFSQDEVNDETILRDVQKSSIQSKQARSMSDLPIGLSMWQSKRFQSRDVPILRDEQENKKTMGAKIITGEITCSSKKGAQETPHYISRFVLGHELANKTVRQPTMDLDLGRRFQENDLPLSLDLDDSQWGHPLWALYSPQEWRSNGRPNREFRTNEAKFSRSTPWAEHTQIVSSKVANPYLSDVRYRISPQGTLRQAVEILFLGMLPPGTPLYDIIVEDDHSFVIEGLFAHNTNCKCYWDIRQVGGEWHCYWRLQPAEHCPDCLENTAKWNPLILPVVATASRKDILEFLSHAKFAS